MNALKSVARTQRVNSESAEIIDHDPDRNLDHPQHLMDWSLA